MQPLPSPHAPITRRMLLRAILKALCLFFIFNVVYGLVKPAQRGLLPSLYNVAFPGRVRFMKDYEFDAYRLIDNHIISAARSDTFNIVILGSSEMWGTRSLADLSVPVILDRLNLVAADGRPVRVYNLAHPVPYGLKDLVLMEVVFRRKIPVDLIILSTFDITLSYYYPQQPIARTNFDLELDVVAHYHLSNAYQFMQGIHLGRSVPVFLQLWEDRSALRIWLEMQMRGIDWAITRLDLSNVSADHLTITRKLDRFYRRLTLDRLDPGPTPDFLYAFRQLSQERGLPVVILAAPVPYEANDFAPWLQTQVESVGLPLIDCWNVFRDPSVFEDDYHIRREMHGSYAYILAAMLNDPRLAAESAGLPLQAPPEIASLPESCALYPSAAAR